MGMMMPIKSNRSLRAFHTIMRPTPPDRALSCPITLAASDYRPITLAMSQSTRTAHQRNNKYNTLTHINTQLLLAAPASGLRAFSISPMSSSNASSTFSL